MTRDMHGAAMPADGRPAASGPVGELRRPGRIGRSPVRLITLILVVAVVAGVAAVPILAIEIFSQSADYSFRLTLVVDANGTARQASSVIRIVQRKPPHWLGDIFTLQTHVDGEAVFLDLRKNRNVVATLTFGPNGRADLLYSLVPRVFHVHFFADTPEQKRDSVPAVGTRAALVGDNIPTLVTFSDVKDPSTARVVRPEEFSDVFGHGVKLQAVTIEITNDPVTRRIEGALPLISVLRERARGGDLLIGTKFTPLLYYFVRGSVK